MQGARLGSMVPVGGCLPPDHGASVESIEFRAGGLKRQRCKRECGRGASVPVLCSHAAVVAG